MDDDCGGVLKADEVLHADGEGVSKVSAFMLPICSPTLVVTSRECCCGWLCWMIIAGGMSC